MHIVVCVKGVPDIHTAQLDPVTHTLIRTGIPGKVNPDDLVALEVALTLKEGGDTRVTLLTMGPPNASTTLTQCLAYGADRAILLTDPVLAGSDGLATSYALSLAIWKLYQQTPVDLVLCGTHTIDGHTAQIGPGIARHLGWQQLTAVTGIRNLDLPAKNLTAERQLEHGKQVVRTSLPAVLSVAADASTVREASLPNLIAAVRINIDVWSAEDIGADPALVGLPGSPTQVITVNTPPVRTTGELRYVEKMGLEATVAAITSLLRQ